MVIKLIDVELIKRKKVAVFQPLPLNAVRFSKVGMRRLERPTPTSRT